MRHAAPRTHTRLAVLTAGGLVVVPAAVAVLGLQEAAVAGSNPGGKVTICHATNSDTHPYVVHTPNKDGHVSGHGKHTGPIWSAGLKDAHVAWGDIIPPFDYMDHKVAKHYDGLNWSAEGQAWWSRACQAPPTPSPSPSPSPSESPSPSPSPSPTESPTPPPFTGGGGGTVQLPPVTGGGGGPTTLPRTGSPAAPLVGFGLLLVMTGSGMVMLVPARRTA
jgi:hypothetical protein